MNRDGVGILLVVVQNVNPNFHTEPSHLAVLAAQRVDTEALAADAESRGWVAEASRHRRLIERLDVHITRAQTR